MFQLHVSAQCDGLLGPPAPVRKRRGLSVCREVVQRASVSGVDPLFWSRSRCQEFVGVWAPFQARKSLAAPCCCCCSTDEAAPDSVLTSERDADVSQVCLGVLRALPAACRDWEFVEAINYQKTTCD